MNYRKFDKLASQWAFSALQAIRSSAWFPLKTGNLRDNATYQRPVPSLIGVSASSIVFDESVAPYIPFLEHGTKPHDIPGAFGRPLPFGIGGRYTSTHTIRDPEGYIERLSVTERLYKVKRGYFHPGSVKHVGFIADRSTALAFQVVLMQCRKIGTVRWSQ